MTWTAQNVQNVFWTPKQQTYPPPEITLMLYLVCFDISDNKTRNRAGKYLSAFGSRVQESVFEVELADADALAYVQDKLGSWLADGDDLRFYCLCRNCRLKSYNAKHERIAKLPSLVII